MKKLMYSVMLLLASVPAFAQEAVAQVATEASNKGELAYAAAIVMAIAAVGGALGQGMTAKAGLEGIARNPAAQPKIFVPMIIGLALIESLVIYALVIAFKILG